MQEHTHIIHVYQKLLCILYVPSYRIQVAVLMGKVFLREILLAFFIYSKPVQTGVTWTSGTLKEIEPINSSSAASDYFQEQRELFQLNQRKAFHILCWGPSRGFGTINPFQWYGFFHAFFTEYGTEPSSCAVLSGKEVLKPGQS
jgi:hypothetical protein